MDKMNINNIIETESLTKVFGGLAAVNEVTLKIDRGDIFGLVGPDGAGKTTLLRMLCGLITPSRGRISRNSDSFGYMPQKFSLYGDLTIAENINFFGALYKIDSKTIRRRADEILEITGLAGFKSRFADDLSGGMKQKLALTCALLAKPALLVLDEPTYGVDPESRKEFWKILYQLNKEGVTIVVSTPYMDEAELCKTVALISRGIIMSTGDPGSLKKSFPYGILELKADARDLDFINDLPEVVDGDFYGDKYHVAVYEVEQAKAAIINLLAEKKVAIHHLRHIPPSMEDVFVAVTKEEVV
ncbi:MAG: putative ABC transporter ATP-binding protein YbhF [Pelotomaculum sp. PtaB.Bin117]|nr:MAG: putative ABC transporter ATP-binding protein YbhF [Pelotomaculum sp. PtaB.Bin117]OPY60684.1 MAG: putative ABC transporter ATP-binding protein YbhF [Pelotomaculum sp. PtaU1.Bin065]